MSLKNGFCCDSICRHRYTLECQSLSAHTVSTTISVLLQTKCYLLNFGLGPFYIPKGEGSGGV